MFVQLNYPPKRKVRVHHARNPKTGREKNPYGVYHLMSSIYTYLKKKQQCKLNISEQESSTLGFPPPPAGWGSAGSGCRQLLPTGTGVSRRLDGTIPTCSIVWHGCRLGTGEQTTVGLGTMVPGEKQSGYRAGGHRGRERSAPRYSQDPKQQQVSKKGREKLTAGMPDPAESYLHCAGP